MRAFISTQYINGAFTNARINIHNINTINRKKEY